MTCPQCGKEPEFRREGDVAGFYCGCKLAFIRRDLGTLSDEEIREEMEGLWMGNVENLPLRRRLDVENKSTGSGSPLVDAISRDGEIPVDPWSRGIRANVTVHPKKEDTDHA